MFVSMQHKHPTSIWRVMRHELQKNISAQYNCFTDYTNVFERLLIIWSFNSDRDNLLDIINFFSRNMNMYMWWLIYINIIQLRVELIFLRNIAKGTFCVSSYH